MSKIEEIIARIPGWPSGTEMQITPLQGLTNTNYSVTVHGERFVVRVSGENTVRLGINRKHELEALVAASNAGLGAVDTRFARYFGQPQKHREAA
jgi:thiamine kinase-like enzyme